VHAFLRVRERSESGSGITINGNEERRAHLSSAFRRGTGKMGSKRGWYKGEQVIGLLLRETGVKGG